MRLLAVVHNKAVVEHLLVGSETDVILRHQDRAWKCVLARRTSRLPEVGTEMFEARREDLFDIGTRLSFADSKLRWTRIWSLTTTVEIEIGTCLNIADTKCRDIGWWDHMNCLMSKGQKIKRSALKTIISFCTSAPSLPEVTKVKLDVTPSGILKEEGYGQISVKGFLFPKLLKTQ